MLSFDDAIALALRDLPRLSDERVPLQDANHRVLARDVRTSFPLPPFDYSERDGYAVNTGTLRGEPPYRLPVTKESRAGESLATLEGHAAVRLFTGAPLPGGADGIVMQEEVVRRGDEIELSIRPASGRWVRRRGEDLAEGATALSAGARLGPGSLALAAMTGQAELIVASRPRVVVLPNGDELRRAGETLSPGQIFESNAVALVALAEQAGAVARLVPTVRDEPEALTAALDQAMASCDLLVTIGGVSVGDRDLIRPCLERLGVSLGFWRVAIKPGRPLALGHRGDARVLCLPGNPASSLVTFGLFGMPLLRALQGDAQPRPPFLSARLKGSALCSPEREQFLRARIEASSEGLMATPLAQQASGDATSLALSNGLVRIPRGDGELSDGAPVLTIRWSDM